MDSHRKDVDGAAGGIEAGIRDVLVIAGQPIHSAEVGTVEQIKGLFRGSRDGAVTNKSIHAAHPEVFRVYARNPSSVATNACDILWARPGGTLRQKSNGRRAIV